MSLDVSALDADQQVAATAPRGPVAILAGAGTGKTRTIIYRIAHLVNAGLTSPDRVLAVTYTRRAAGEMRHRLNLMGIRGVQARTFHSAALRQLDWFWPQYAGDMPWELLDSAFPLAARALRAVGASTEKEDIRDVLREIEWAKAALVSPEGYVASVDRWKRTPPLPAEQVAQAYARYEEMKVSSDVVKLDFSDILIQMAGALESSAAIANQFRAQYSTFIVDEYQDVTPLQQRLLDAWLGERDDLTVVGDANQTIYSFTGATPDYLLNFTRTYPHAEVVKLQRDYRSTPQVVELANTVIGKAKGRAAGTRLTLEGMRDPGPAPSYHSYPDEDAEARAVAAAIRALIDAGTPAREIAILYRVNAQSEPYERALSDAGVFYQVRGGDSFYSRPVVREAFRQLARAAQDPQLTEGAVGVNLHRLVVDLFAPLGLSPKEPDGALARERWQVLRALADLAAEMGRVDASLDLRGFLTEIERRSKDRQPPSVDGVTLATMHAAKGLEWDAVFLVGLVEDMLPSKHAIKAGAEQIEEERRLFYVGITRAREYLHLSWALARQEGRRGHRTRTRFLDGIVPDVDISAPGKARRRASRCRVCNTPLQTPRDKVLGRHESCPSEADAAVFAALRVWRAAVAKEKNVPAYLIFTDATLMAIAEAAPSTPQGLLDVSGVGPMKLQEYGPGLLETLAQFT